MAEVTATDLPTGLPPGVNPWRGRIFLLSLVHTVGTACYLSIMAMGPIIREDLDITAAQFGFFMSAVFGAQLFSAIPSGIITDRLGVGWTLFGAMLTMFSGTLFFSIAEDFEAALIAAFLIGLGYSFVNPATAKGVVRWFPPQWRGTAMGLKQLGVPLGGVIGAGGGALAAFMDWQNVLWIAATMTFIAALMWLPLTRKPSWGVGGMHAIIRDLKIVLANRNMNAICCSCIFLNTGQSSLFAYTALFLRDAAQASQPVAALGVAFAQGASAFGRVGFSYLSDTVFEGRRKGVVAGVIFVGVIACVVAYFVNPSWPHWGLMLLVTVMGGTLASYAALILAMTAESVPENLVGSAIGFNGVAWSIGGMVGPPLFGQILDMTGNQYGMSWLIVAVLMLIGAFVLLVFAKEKP